MEHSNNAPLAALCGILGGMVKFLQVSVIEVTWWEKTLQAGGTALICGFLGVAGKELFVFIKKAFFKRKKVKQ